MSNTIISSSELSKRNIIDLNCKSNEFSNSTFWYYTSVDTASLILNSLSFYVSNLEIMNDVDEAKLHEKEKNQVHALCFCNSNTEKIPMWYLYAGLTGKGAAIGFTPSVMLEFLRSIDEISALDGTRILKKNVDFEFKFGWVYYKKGSGIYQYKREWYELPNADIEAFEKDNYFIKNYPWEYEKEFRIDFVNRTDISEDRLVVKFPSTILKKIKIRLAPELDNETVIKEVMSKDGFKRYLKEKLILSTLDVHMDLFNRNIKDIQSFIINVIDESPKKLDLPKIKAAIDNQLNIKE